LNIRIFGDVAAYICSACGWFCFVYQTYNLISNLTRTNKLPDDDPLGLKHVGENSVTSVTACVIIYLHKQVHKLVKTK